MTHENSNRVWAILCLLTIVLVAAYWLSTRPEGTTGQRVGAAIDAFTSDVREATDEVRDEDFTKKVGNKLRSTEQKLKRHLDNLSS